MVLVGVVVVLCHVAEPAATNAACGRLEAWHLFLQIFSFAASFTR
jgi:hypothetical protein